MASAKDKPNRPTVKPTWGDVKAKLADFDRAGLVGLVADLYAFHKDNQAFLHARFALGANPLDSYKRRIRAVLAPDIMGSRRVEISVATARKAISDYTKAVGDPLGVLELRAFWCETAVAFSMDFGYADEGYFDALLRQYRDACRTLSALNGVVLEGYIERLEHVRGEADMGYGVRDVMRDLIGDAVRRLPVAARARVRQSGDDSSIARRTGAAKQKAFAAQIHLASDAGVDVRGNRLTGDSAAAFQRYIGIDYSGAETPNASLKGLRVYMAQGSAAISEVEPPPSPRKYWTRRGIAQWLVERLAEDIPTLVGIDHGFSFPLRYFDKHGLPRDWPAFLEDFQRHWPTDDDHTYVDFVRFGARGQGADRMGNAKWRRITELRAGSAKSVFHFDVQGQVAKSTHTGIPWLRFIRQKAGDRVHFWPFDGWDIPTGRSAIAEVYPALWKRDYPSQGRTPDQHDAYAVASWLRQADRDDRLRAALNPDLTEEERRAAGVEGWILGVG